MQGEDLCYDCMSQTIIFSLYPLSLPSFLVLWPSFFTPCNGLKLDLPSDIKTGIRCFVDCIPTPLSTTCLTLTSTVSVTLLRLFPFPYLNSWPDHLPNPDRPPILLSMTDRPPKASFLKILQQYPYRSPTIPLSIQHVTLCPHWLHSRLHLPTCCSPYHGLWLIGLTPLSLTDYNTYDTDPDTVGHSQAQTCI